MRNRGGLTRLTYAYHPFDVVGWDGCLYPYAFNIADFEPIVKRTHAPPPVHQTFEGPNFVICSFCPRPLDFDPEAVPIPYNHHNVDSDEMMFYVAGDYTARKGSGVGIGSITLHPSGFTHGPQPGAVEAVIRGLAEGKSATDETAVMIDTFRPLLLAPASQPRRGPGVCLELGQSGPRLTASASQRLSQQPGVNRLASTAWAGRRRSRGGRMPPLPQRAREMFEGPNFATVATLQPDGRPQTSVVWVRTDGDDVLFSTIKGRRKYENMVRDPRLSVLVFAAADPYSYTEVRGTAEITDDPRCQS